GAGSPPASSPRADARQSRCRHGRPAVSVFTLHDGGRPRGGATVNSAARRGGQEEWTRMKQFLALALALSVALGLAPVVLAQGSSGASPGTGSSSGSGASPSGST